MRKTDPELLKNILIPRKERLKKVEQARSAAEEKVEKVEKVEQARSAAEEKVKVPSASQSEEVIVEIGKRCKTCQEVKQTSEFYKVGKYYMSSCKVCQNKARQELRKKKKADVTQTEELKKPELVRQENEEVVEESESEESEESEEDLSVYTLQENETHEAYYKRLKNELGSDAPKKKKNESFEDYYNKVQKLIIAYSEGSQ